MADPLEIVSATATRTPPVPTAVRHITRAQTWLAVRLSTFTRSLVTGGAASLADLATLGVAVGAFEVSPATASIPALLTGASVQFFGNRHFAFRATSGRVRRQALLFVATEVMGLIFNALLYDRVAALLPATATSAVFGRVVTTNLVFLLWSYPMWCRVFRTNDMSQSMWGKAS
ncbi:Hypothetical protein A7982_03914 [Minicystis rosea]|nr:Hypothetical protein A7982_03914 [Minicystis rosea]